MTTTLTARGPEDLLAAVPVVLGFHPSESLVMLTFGASRTFHARVDLPPPGADDETVDEAAAEVADALLAPCLTHHVGRVVLVFYTTDPALAARLTPVLSEHFDAAGIGVLEVLRVDARSWCRLRPDGGEEAAQPHDALVHPFTAQAVFEGRVTHSSREELRDSIAALPGAAERVAAARASLPTRGSADPGWLLETLAGHVRRRTDPDDGETARILAAISRVATRDAALHVVTRDTAADHLRVWTGVLRRAPDDQVTEAAALTAFCAWMAGDGALAWCSLDRCLAADPDHRLALCLAECLARAVPPTAWEEVSLEETADGDLPGCRVGPCLNSAADP